MERQLLIAPPRLRTRKGIRARSLANQHKKEGAGSLPREPRFRTIRSFPKWHKKIPKPFPGADVTVRQVVPGLSFNNHSGIAAGNQILLDGTLAKAVQLNFGLSDLAQAGSWTTVFDQYRFDEIRLVMRPIMDAVNVIPGTLAPGVIHVVVDFDDSSALGSEAAAIEYEHIKTLYITDGLELTLYPTVTPAVFSGGAFSGYGIQAADDGWLNCASNNIPHYGVKMYGNAVGNASGDTGWIVWAEYTVSFKYIH